MCLETWDSIQHLPELVLGQGCLAYVLQLTQHALHGWVLEPGALEQAARVPKYSMCRDLFSSLCSWKEGHWIRHGKLNSRATVPQPPPKAHFKGSESLKIW